MTRLRLAVIGVGHLGKEHARILAGMSAVELVGVADVNAAQAEAVALRCGTQAFGDYRALLPLVDAAVVVVPTLHHHAVAAEFLHRGVPVLVEKPLAANLAEAKELVELAQRQGVLLQVGHIERFNPAFEELARRPSGRGSWVASAVGPFSGRSTDIGAVLDLMIHDLDLLLALVRSPVRDVTALGASVLGGHEDVAQARVVFENGCVANLTASRISTAPVAAHAGVVRRGVRVAGLRKEAPDADPAIRGTAAAAAATGSDSTGQYSRQSEAELHGALPGDVRRWIARAATS